MVDPRLLRDIIFFSGLNDEELRVISKLLEKKVFKEGDIVFKEGEEGKLVYIIRRGEVKACKTTPDGDLLTLTLHKDGDIFGEMSFLDDRPRSATIVANKETETYVLERKDFEALVDTHPRLIYKMLKTIVSNIHSIVKRMNAGYSEMISYMWGRRR